MGPNNIRLMDEMLPKTSEREVLQWLMQGYSNEEIAAVAGFTERTVKYYVSCIFDKSGQYTRSRLMAHMWSLGWDFKAPVVAPSAKPAPKATVVVVSPLVLPRGAQ